jgi:hypothetical protein
MLHVALGELGTDESGGVQVVCEDGGLRQVDGKSLEVGYDGGLDHLVEGLRCLEVFLGVG